MVRANSNPSLLDYSKNVVYIITKCAGLLFLFIFIFVDFNHLFQTLMTFLNFVKIFSNKRSPVCYSTIYFLPFSFLRATKNGS